MLGQRLLGGSVLFWPVLLGLVGLAVLWRQADEAQRERWVDSTGRIDFLRAVVGSGGVASYARLAAGVGLLLSALVLFALQTGDAGQLGVARDVVIAGVLGVGGLALMIGPWLFRLTGDLSEERAARVRSQERADMAAHLHDSVLQTLALIQKHADDGRTVATLARAQERDLRSWLYGDHPAPGTSVAGALRAAAAEVEDGHGVPVEVVIVGDAPVSERLEPLVLAAREAMVNAARHSGAAQVDVYAECDDARRRGLRARPRPRLRRDRGPRGPARRPQQHPGPDAPARRHRRGADRARRGHRGAARDDHRPHRRPTDGGRMSTPIGRPRTVVVVDDHAMFRTGVKAELAAQPDRVEVLGEAADVDEAVAAVTALHPEVVLLDVHLPGGGGAEVMRRVGCQAARHPVPRAVGLRRGRGRHRHDPGRRPRLRHQDHHRSRAGRRHRPGRRRATRSSRPGWPGFVLDAFAGSIAVAQVDEDLDRLTEREREVMRLIARGYAYKEVASELFISIKTVETHVSSVLRKLQLSSRHELTRWASDRRLL